MSQKTVKRERRKAKEAKAKDNGATPPASVQKRPPLSVPYDLADNILGYLGTKPYQEVAPLVAGLLRCAPQLKKKE